MRGWCFKFMMTPDRLSHIAHLFLESLQENGAIEDKNRAQVLKKIKAYLEMTDKKFDRATELAEAKVRSTKKNLVIGTQEYNLQVERAFLEEIRRV